MLTFEEWTEIHHQITHLIRQHLTEDSTKESINKMKKVMLLIEKFNKVFFCYSNNVLTDEEKRKLLLRMYISLLLLLTIDFIKNHFFAIIRDIYLDIEGEMKRFLTKKLLSVIAAAPLSKIEKEMAQGIVQSGVATKQSSKVTPLAEAVFNQDPTVMQKILLSRPREDDIPRLIYSLLISDTGNSTQKLKIINSLFRYGLGIKEKIQKTHWAEIVYLSLVKLNAAKDIPYLFPSKRHVKILNYLIAQKMSLKHYRYNDAIILQSIVALNKSKFFPKSDELNTAAPFMNHRLMLDGGENHRCPFPHQVALFANYKTFFLLKKRGLDIDRLDETNATPLHYAAAAGRFELVGALIFAGAKVDALNDAGETPLHLAVKNILGLDNETCLKTAKALILAGAKKTIATPSGHTAFDYLCCYLEDDKSYEEWHNVFAIKQSNVVLKRKVLSLFDLTATFFAKKPQPDLAYQKHLPEACATHIEDAWAVWHKR